MTETTARLHLPYILPGQAQKEIFHNEALARLDVAVAPAVEGIAAAPPAAPEEGRCWIVAGPATGAWTDHEGLLACWSPGGWRFVAPVVGMLVWKKAERLWVYWTGSAWSDGELPASRIVVQGKQVMGPRQAAVPSPSGGTTIDVEARLAIDALIVALKSHGLTD